MDLGAAHRPLRRFVRLRAACAALAVAGLACSPRSVPRGRPAATPDGTAQVADVDDRLDLVLADGRTVRFGGVAPPDPARAPDLADGGARRSSPPGSSAATANSSASPAGRTAGAAWSRTSQLSDPGRRRRPATPRRTTLLAAGYARCFAGLRGARLRRRAASDRRRSARAADSAFGPTRSAAVIDAADAEGAQAKRRTVRGDRGPGAEGWLWPLAPLS